MSLLCIKRGSGFMEEGTGNEEDPLLPPLQVAATIDLAPRSNRASFGMKLPLHHACRDPHQLSFSFLRRLTQLTRQTGASRVQAIWEETLCLGGAKAPFDEVKPERF